MHVHYFSFFSVTNVNTCICTFQSQGIFILLISLDCSRYTFLTNNTIIFHFALPGFFFNRNLMNIVTSNHYNSGIYLGSLVNLWDTSALQHPHFSHLYSIDSFLKNRSRACCMVQGVDPALFIKCNFFFHIPINIKTGTCTYMCCSLLYY